LPLPDGPEAPYVSFDKMKARNKINELILGSYLEEIKVGGLDRIKVTAYNRGNGSTLGKWFGIGKEWKMFKEVQDAIDRRKTVIAALFPGFDSTERSAKEEEWTSESHIFQFTLDWVRAELLKRIVRIKDGDETARGELKILFTHAKKYYGSTLDHDKEYKVFFTGEILSYMYNFTQSFRGKFNN